MIDQFPLHRHRQDSSLNQPTKQVVRQRHSFFWLGGGGAQAPSKHHHHNSLAFSFRGILRIPFWAGIGVKNQKYA
jgi:hypothetical protein